MSQIRRMKENSRDVQLSSLAKLYVKDFTGKT